MQKPWSRLAILVGISVLCGGLPAAAENIKYSFNQNGLSWFGDLRQDIAVNNNGNKLLNFSTPSKDLIGFTLSADCQLIGREQSIVDVDVIVDGSVIAITDGDDVFCSGRGIDVEGGWARQSITFARTLEAGSHSLRIKAKAVGLHSFARIEDITILIWR